MEPTQVELLADLLSNFFSRSTATHGLAYYTKEIVTIVKIFMILVLSMKNVLTEKAF
jgi:hypothetical protein